MYITLSFEYLMDASRKLVYYLCEIDPTFKSFLEKFWLCKELGVVSSVGLSLLYNKSLAASNLLELFSR